MLRVSTRLSAGATRATIPRDLGLDTIAATRVATFLAAPRPQPWSSRSLSAMVHETAATYQRTRALLDALPASDARPLVEAAAATAPNGGSRGGGLSAAALIVATAHVKSLKPLHDAASRHFAQSLQFAAILSPEAEGGAVKAQQLSSLLQPAVQQLVTYMTSHRIGGWTWLIYNPLTSRVEVMNTDGLCPLVLGAFPLAALNVTHSAFLALDDGGATPSSASSSTPAPAWSRRARLQILHPQAAATLWNATGSSDGDTPPPSLSERRRLYAERVVARLDYDFLEEQLKAAVAWASSPERVQKRESHAAMLKKRALEVYDGSKVDAVTDDADSAHHPPQPAQTHDAAPTSTDSATAAANGAVSVGSASSPAGDVNAAGATGGGGGAAAPAADELAADGTKKQIVREQAMEGGGRRVTWSDGSFEDRNANGDKVYELRSDMAKVWHFPNGTGQDGLLSTTQLKDGTLAYAYDTHTLWKYTDGREELKENNL